MVGAGEVGDRDVRVVGVGDGVPYRVLVGVLVGWTAIGGGFVRDGNGDGVGVRVIWSVDSVGVRFVGIAFSTTAQVGEGSKGVVEIV